MIFKGKVIIFSEKRKNAIVKGYRPHLAEKRSENLLGIEFIEVKEDALDKYVDCIIKTSYEWIDYSSLEINKKYDVREGKNIVGEIILLEIVN